MDILKNVFVLLAILSLSVFTLGCGSEEVANEADAPGDAAADVAEEGAREAASETSKGTVQNFPDSPVTGVLESLSDDQKKKLGE